MAEVVQHRIENVANVVRVFRKEQEGVILRSIDDSKFSRAARLKHQTDPNQPESFSNNNLTENVLPKLINNNCILMPQPPSAASYQSLWPLALNANKGTAGVGFIEAQGSLWKMIQKSDAFPGFRVLLQTADGEEVFYLNKSMQLVALKADAAVWNLKLANSSKNPNITTQAISSVDPSDPLNANNKGGVFVQFELVEATPSSLPELPSSNNGHLSIGRGAVSSAAASVPQTRMLVCSHVELVGKSELSLCAVPNESTFQTNVQDSNGLRSSRTFIWEVMPESWIDGELDFLDGFLN